MRPGKRPGAKRPGMKHPPKRPQREEHRGQRAALHTGRPLPTGGRRHVEQETNILAGVKIPGKGRGKQPKNWTFWQCAGPVRSGCGHSGAFVVGDHDERPGIRLRGQAPFPTHGLR